MTTHGGHRKLGGRTAVFTAAAVIGVTVAGATAVAANLGLLQAGGDGDIGQLSAGDLAPAAESQVVEIPAGGATTSTDVVTVPPAAAEAQRFAVDAAGTVSVVPTADGVRLGDLAVNPGWTWVLSQTSASNLQITFVDGGGRVLEFTSFRNPDGSVTGAVDDVTVTPAAGTAVHGDDDHGGDRERESDDGHEQYEGHDDDD
jgi:hypothetical protein